MSNNMKDRFVSSNFDEVDMVLDTDRRFDEAIAAAENGDSDLIETIIKDLEESCVLKTIKEEDVIQYNPEDIEVNDIVDATAQDIHEYVSEEDYDDEDGEIIDSIVNGEEWEE